MKKYITLFLLLASTLIQAQTKDGFIGNWATNDKSLVVEIYIQDNGYYAKVVSGQSPEMKDKVVLIQMAKKSDTQLYGGTYYDADLKTEYEARMKLLDANTIRLTGLNGLFHKTIVWHRISPWDAKANEITVIQH